MPKMSVRTYECTLALFYAPLLNEFHFQNIDRTVCVLCKWYRYVFCILVLFIYSYFNHPYYYLRTHNNVLSLSEFLIGIRDIFLTENI